MAADGSGDLTGWLNKYRKGVFWDGLDRRYFSLNESPSCIDSSGDGAGGRATMMGDLGCMTYYLSNQRGANMKGSYYICKDTVCHAMPTKPGFKSGFGFFVRGILNNKNKQIILVAESETIRDEWVERINNLIDNKDILSGWLVEQNRKQFCVLSLVKKDKFSMSLWKVRSSSIGRTCFLTSATTFSRHGDDFIGLKNSIP